MFFCIFDDLLYSSSNDCKILQVCSTWFITTLILTRLCSYNIIKIKFSIKENTEIIN